MTKIPAPVRQDNIALEAISFADLGLEAGILEILDQIGFAHPTPIQAQVIPQALAGRDIIGLAETGSGKTAAFGLPLAQQLTHGRGVRGLILSPTREIAMQTKGFLDLFGQKNQLTSACIIGGMRMQPQIDRLRGAPDIVVATPGRLVDHLQRGTVSLRGVETLVLDEADRMLDMGFLPQLRKVLAALPERRQTLLFSATMPREITRFAERIQQDAMRIDVLPEGGTASGIEHRLYLVDDENRKPCLLALLHQETGSTLVFIRRKVDAEWLNKVLEKEGHPVERIHGDLSQAARVQALRGFSLGEHRILVATDVAARGIDIPGIEHIIHFAVPETVEDYIHRSGRTARGDSVGTVSTIATWRDKETIGRIEREIGQQIPRCTVPGVEFYQELERRLPRRSRSPIRR